MSEKHTDWEELDNDQKPYNKNATPTLFKTSKQELTKCYKHYCQAEEIISYVSVTLGGKWGHDIPAINQLRYAGRHIIDALQDSNEAGQYDSIRKAVGHCHRSCYDAAEAGTMALLELINDFIDRYNHMVVTDIIAGYNDMRARSREIAKSIGKNSRFDGEEYFKKSYGYFKELEKIYDTFDSARQELNVKYKKEVRADYFKIMSIGVPIIVAIIYLIARVAGS